jgi:hypothetical protein
MTSDPNNSIYYPIYYLSWRCSNRGRGAYKGGQGPGTPSSNHTHKNEQGQQPLSLVASKDDSWAEGRRASSFSCRRAGAAAARQQRTEGKCESRGGASARAGWKQRAQAGEEVAREQGWPGVCTNFSRVRSPLLPRAVSLSFPLPLARAHMNSAHALFLSRSRASKSARGDASRRFTG